MKFVGVLTAFQNDCELSQISLATQLCGALAMRCAYRAQLRIRRIPFFISLHARLFRSRQKLSLVASGVTRLHPLHLLLALLPKL